MFAAWLEKLTRREDLTEAEASAAMTEVMTGRATPAQTSALLVALAMKGERPEEVVGLARTMRAQAVRVPGVWHDLFDTCGTGGDGSGTFNISSAAALIVAACGVRVAKHGNRSMSSRSGSADVFEALGVRAAASPDVVAACLHEAGIGFCFAQTFHPSMKHAAAARREMGIRTAFNLLGPLTNPAGARRQLVGVPRPELTELVARALLLLGAERAWVVHGADGLDEISTTGYTKVSECQGGTVRTFYVHPADFGLGKVPVAALMGGAATENAAIVRDVLAGASGPARDIVVLNAGASLLIAGAVTSIVGGMARAAAAIDSGAASATLARMAEISQRPDTEGAAEVRG